MKEIEELPADELIVMTELLHRLFNAGGCDPMCHCCENMLKVGSMFKLSTIKEASGYMAGDSLKFWKKIYTGKIIPTKAAVKKHLNIDIRPQFKANDEKLLDKYAADFQLESKEVMLCDKCSPETFLKKELDCIDKQIEENERTRKGGCFRVNGKIVK